MPYAYDEENARSLDDLRTLVARLDDPALATDLRGGWTVGTALAHLAYWDRRNAAVCALWQRGGTTYPSPADDQIDEADNEALTPLLRLIPGRAAAELCIESARAANAALAALTPELAARATAPDSPGQPRTAPDSPGQPRTAPDSPIVAHRYRHRREHIAQIDAALLR